MADQASHESIPSTTTIDRSRYGSLRGAKLAESLGDIVRGSRPSDLGAFETLDFSNWSLGTQGLKILDECLLSGHLSNLKELNLARNYVGAVGLVALVQCFKAGQLSNLKELNLYGNSLRDEGMVALVEGFKGGHLSILKELNLAWNHVGDAGLVVFAKGFKAGHLSNLEKLDLAGNYVGDVGLVTLAEGFKAGHLSNLVELNLSGNNVGDVGLVAISEVFKVGHLSTLEELNLAGNNVGEEGMVALVEGFKGGHLSILKELNLAWNHVGDAGLVALAEGFEVGHLSTLEELNLTRNNVGDAGLVALVKSFQKSSSKSLVHWSSLQKVFLDSAHVFGEEGILDLARALEAGDLQSLTTLELGRVAQVARRAIVSAYQNNLTLGLDLRLDFIPFDFATKTTLKRLRNRNLKWRNTYKVLECEPKVSGTNGKVILCGSAEIGKTTLKETLVRKRWQTILTSEKKLGKDLKRTRGIEVSHMIVSKDKGSSNKQSLMLSLWDLAGQPDYDVLHSAFLPDLAFGDGQSTFFVIVCSANRPGSSVTYAEDDLLYWLRFISSYSTGSRHEDLRRKVLVVLNCFEGVRSHHILEEWKGILVKCTKKFGNFVDIHHMPFIVDARLAKEVKSLKSELKMQAKEMLLNSRVPAICVRVQDTCREWAKNHTHYPVLSWEQYSSTLFADLISQEKLEAATAYLHEVGQLVLFKKGSLTQGGLDDVTLVILNPEWLCKKVVGNLLLPECMALENENPLRREVQRDGSLPTSTLQGTLDIPADKVEEVLAILLHLGLCYLAPSQPEKIFVPALIETDDTPQWPRRACSSIRNQNSAWVMGFSLVLEDSSTTLLPIAFLRKLQVELAQDKTIGGRSDCELTLGKSFITFSYEGKSVWVEFSSNPRHSEDRRAKTKSSKQDRLDILVTPLQSVDEANSASSREEQVNLAQRFVDRAMGISTECPGVKLVRKIIKPWNVSDGLLSITDRNTSTSVDDVIARVQENGWLGTMNWTVGDKLVKEEELLSEGDLEGFQFFTEARCRLQKEVLERLDLSDIIHKPIESNVDPDHIIDNLVESNVGPNPQTCIIIGKLENISRENAKMHQITHKKVDEVNNNVKDVKACLNKVLKEQKDIIHRVLSIERFTTGNAESSVPRYAYLKEVGKPNGWVHHPKAALKSLCMHNFTLHFLCEAPQGNLKLHEVDGQVGVDVKKLTEWADTLAPVLEWSLKIAFFIAKFAGSFFLPGLGVLIPDLAIDFTNAAKVTSGIASLLELPSSACSSAHQHHSASDSRAKMLGQSSKAEVTTLHYGDRQQQLRGDARAAVKDLLAQLASQEFKQQVGLRRVRILNPTYGDTDHVVWICEKCFDNYGNRAMEI